jgi:hypothetical protein
VESAVEEMVTRFRQVPAADLTHPRHFNIRWMQMLEEAAAILGIEQSIFSA